MLHARRPQPEPEEDIMKSFEHKREAKKKPAMTMKEKKAAKNAKKALKSSAI